VENKNKKITDILFKGLTTRRIFGMLLGNLGIGIGVSVFHFSGLGNDPYSGMILGLSALAGVSYGTFLLCLNSVLFIVQLLFAREYIGLGTLVNWVFVGYTADFTYMILTKNVSLPTHLLPQIFIMLLGVLTMSFAVSLYQSADAGISPYDSLPFAIQKKVGKSYFWCRIFCDAFCAVICFISGGVIGLGTFTCAFCLGPFITFFNKNISEKIIHK
jgi:uncharacterized membrane protein YczE